MADTVRPYEGLFLFGTAATADVDGALATVRGMVEKHGGEILVLKKWDDRKLAYEISKQGRGLYVICYFNAPPSTIAPLDREVRLSDTVLRSLVTDASHLSREEMEAVEPQKPDPEAEGRGRRRDEDDDDGDFATAGPRRDRSER